MSDDETVVRQRLLRLLGGRADPGPVIPGPPRAAVAPPARLPGARAVPHATDPAASIRADPSASTRPAGLAEAVQGGASAETVPAPAGLGGLGAFDPGRRGVKALAAVAAVVVLAAAVLAWWSRPQAEPVAAPGTSAAGAHAIPDAGSAGEPGASASAADIVVAVAGKVRRPGLVRLPAGARVADALTAAGGALPGTDVTLLNLARKVTDGELILVGVGAPPGAQALPGADAGSGVGALPGGKVNLNTATLAQLDSLPGVGPVLAQRILDHRERHGGFRSVGDLRRVDGIGDARYEQLKELVTV